MPRVVGVRFKPVGKIYYFDPAELDYSVGAKVIVETARGIEYGDVCIAPRDVTEDQVVQPLKRVIRTGSEHDAQIVEENRRRQKEAFAAAREKIEAHSLDMHLCDVEYTFDRSKIIFYFTAEGRIDFRDLVKDLASVFRTRIEMRQIGVRDEAKLIGGIGPCGRILCCSSFLGEFSPVSIRMAKDQNLSLNPTKISGVCGRLMCCLRYEQETYEAAKKDPTLAPGYVPPPLEKVEEYVKGYQDDDAGGPGGGRFFGLPQKVPLDPVAPSQVHISSAPRPTASNPPARPAGQRSVSPSPEQRRGQGSGQKRAQGQLRAGSPRPGQAASPTVGQGGQQTRVQGQTQVGQQPRGQGASRPAAGQPPREGRGQGQPQAGQQPRGQGAPRPAAPPQREGDRPPQPEQAGAPPQGQAGPGGEHHHRRRRRHRRGRGHGGAPDGQGGPPANPAPP